MSIAISKWFYFNYVIKVCYKMGCPNRFWAIFNIFLIVSYIWIIWWVLFVPKFLLNCPLGFDNGIFILLEGLESFWGWRHHWRYWSANINKYFWLQGSQIYNTIMQNPLKFGHTFNVTNVFSLIQGVTVIHIKWVPNLTLTFKLRKKCQLDLNT